jgi:peptidoglycan/LPS O-acetylase OafA/YrhL
VLLPTTGAALLIAAGPAAAVNRVVLNNRAMVAIGLISYPLYLWHWPLLSFTEYAWDDKLDTVQRLLIVFAAFPLAWLTYRFAERPLRYASQQRAIVTTALTIAMALMFALGLWTYSMNGFPWRLLP